MARKDIDLSVFDKQMKTTRYSRACAVKLTLSPEQLEMVDAAFESGNYPRAAIQRVIRDWGFRLSERPLNSHRDKVCACYD